MVRAWEGRGEAWDIPLHTLLRSSFFTHTLICSSYLTLTRSQNLTCFHLFSLHTSLYIPVPSTHPLPHLPHLTSSLHITHLTPVSLHIYSYSTFSNPNTCTTHSTHSPARILTLYLIPHLTSPFHTHIHTDNPSISHSTLIHTCSHCIHLSTPA